MDTITQLKKMVEEIEFSDRAKEKINGILAKAELRKGLGKKDKECLSDKDKEILMGTIKADMILDAIEIKSHQASLDEIDKIITGSKK